MRRAGENIAWCDVTLDGVYGMRRSLGPVAPLIAVESTRTLPTNRVVFYEPSNDVDTDMLAAMEDVFDSWPGTLIVVSHDRYLVERITDQQYAIIDGRLRHLPGGMDEYLRLRAAAGSAPVQAKAPATSESSAPRLSGAEERAARAELSATERKLERLGERIADVHERMAAHDQGDYEGLNRLNNELRETEEEAAALEERGFELSELVG